VIGIDDWAWRRGRRFGTILCDLERGRVIDLLPDRSAGAVADWLKQHPTITIVSRDRFGPYAEAAQAGATGAVQVADGWHLIVNCSDALRSILDRSHAQLRKAAWRCAQHGRTAPAVARHRRQPAPPDGKLRAAHLRRWQAHYADVVRLQREGAGIKQIVRQTGLARNTVRRWVRGAKPVPYRRAPGPSLLDVHFPFAEERRRQGCTAAELWRELRQRGFAGGYDIVRRWAARQRALDAGSPLSPLPAWRVPSSRHATRLLTTPQAALGRADRLFVETLRSIAPPIGLVADLSQAFGDLIRERRVDDLETWITTAAATELRGFADGLRRDLAAVRAAITLPWSNGPVEGQINRLKLLKRQMFGRANFDLLRHRVLHAA
jgi:transposase